MNCFILSFLVSLVNSLRLWGYFVHVLFSKLLFLLIANDLMKCAWTLMKYKNWKEINWIFWKYDLMKCAWTVMYCYMGYDSETSNHTSCCLIMKILVRCHLLKSLFKKKTLILVYRLYKLVWSRALILWRQCYFQINDNCI